jgi:hypothetical protein
VAGKVTLDGQPLGAGEVHLYSRTRGTGGRATLDAGGNFKIPVPLPVGDYTAMVTPPAPAIVPGVSPRSTPPGGSPQAAQASTIPVTYWSETTSDLVVKVEADKEVVVTLELHGDVQPASATPATTGPNVATAPPAESPAPAEAGDKGHGEKTPGEKTPGEKTPGEKGAGEKTEDKKIAAAATPGATPNLASNPSPPASVEGAALPTWLLAASGAGLVLAAAAGATFVLLRRRSAPAPAGWTPAPPQPVSAPAGHGQSAAYPRFARPPGANEEQPIPGTQPAIHPAPGAEHLPAAPAGQTAASAETATTAPAEAETVASPAKNAPPEDQAVVPPSETSKPARVPAFEERPAERSIAGWVLERGGRLRLRTEAGESGNLSQASAIPANPFRVTAVLFTAHDTLAHDDFERLAGLESLHLLDLTATNVTDAGLRHVARLEHIRELSLSKTKITDDGLQFLGALQELRVLLLYRTAVTDVGVEHLRNCTNLQLVELKHTRITDAGLQLLTALPRLEQVFVEHTRVTREGVARINAAFPGVKINAFARAASAEPRVVEDSRQSPPESSSSGSSPERMTSAESVSGASSPSALRPR